ncbi:hypothetical protein AVEN_267558-1 [Araneus ventricosus]|uniref:Uncharacterized protein n=1 Tax=Araneus ventricosus TaxID=182803 RepID=A0A4Y2IJS2_ARAVE|nr:hypothetical protein AVEN_267558-1 [Araneus ventricosus]
MFRSPFITKCGFSMMEQQPTSALNATFGARWIGRGGAVPWPSRSPDLSSVDCFSWGHLKSLVHASPVASDEDLDARICTCAWNTWHL